MLGLCSLQAAGHGECIECIENILPFTKRGKRKFTVAVEGNIGSGKSTFLKHFEHSSNVELLSEPVEMWKNIQGHNALELMYIDAERWSLTFQSYVQLTMLQNHTKRQVAPVKMLERSVQSCRYCFVENLHKRKLMPDVDYAVLTEWFDWLVKNEDVDVDLFVYLRASPETCFERIKKRNRQEEAGVPIEYLESLHELHEDWLVRQEKFKPAGPVLVLDADQEFPILLKELENKRSEILCGYA